MKVWILSTLFVDPANQFFYKITIFSMNSITGKLLSCVFPKIYKLNDQNKFCLCHLNNITLCDCCRLAEIQVPLKIQFHVAFVYHHFQKTFYRTIKLILVRKILFKGTFSCNLILVLVEILSKIWFKLNQFIRIHSVHTNEMLKLSKM